MEHLAKRFFVLFLFVMMFAVVGATCDDNQTILKLSSQTNAHGELWNGTNYNYRICYQEIFGTNYSGTNPHNSAYPVLKLSAISNAHGSVTNGVYPIVVGFDGLLCRDVAGNCDLGVGEKEIVRLSSSGNGHLAVAGTTNYPIAICCKSPPPQVTVGQVYWANGLGNAIANSNVNSTVYFAIGGALAAGNPINISVFRKGTLFDSLVDSRAFSADGSQRILYPWKITDSVGGGQYYFSANMSGSNNVSGIIAVSATQGEKLLPIAMIASPINKQIYYANVSINFNQTSYSLSDSIVAYNWTVINGDGNVEFNSNQPYFINNFSSPGQKTVTLRVTDSSGLWGEDQVSILVLGGTGILAYISQPKHMQWLMDNRLGIDGFSTVNFIGNDSYVVNGVASGSPCVASVSCLAGNCPSQTQQSPACSSDSSIKLIVVGGPQPFSGLLFDWNFVDLGVRNSSYGLSSISARYALPSGVPSAQKVVSLTINYSNSANGLSLVQTTNRQFIIASQCSRTEGQAYFYNLTSDGRLQEKNLDPMNTASCAGNDGINGTSDDCCPAGWSCTMGGCRINENITAPPAPKLCERYTTESACNNDDNQVISGGNGIVNYPGLWNSLSCGQRISENGDVYNSECMCAWNSSASGDKCQFTNEKTSVVWPGTLDSPPVYSAGIWNYTMGECLSGYRTWVASCSCLTGTGTCSCGTSNSLTGTSVCGAASIALPFFGLEQFFLSLIALVGIYAVLIRRK